MPMRKQFRVSVYDGTSIAAPLIESLTFYTRSSAGDYEDRAGSQWPGSFINVSPLRGLDGTHEHHATSPYV